MSSNILNQVAFLRTSREFPEELRQLTVEVNKSYIDTSAAVNNRTIGLFSVNRPSINGESWFLTGNQKQQGLRQVYKFTTTADINIGFKLTSISQITNMHGVFLSGTSYFGLIPATTVAIAGQISFWVEVNGASTTSDIIKFATGAGAPALTSGIIVLEWISDP